MDEPLLVSGRISFRDDEFGLIAIAWNYSVRFALKKH